MQQKPNLPQYWELLGEADRREYLKIQSEFSSSNPENRKYKSTKIFRDFIDRLKGFVKQDNVFDKNRALVCGIYWFGNSIAINTRQLMVLISKCKSSINGSFQALGYGTIPPGTNSSFALIRLFPHLAKNFGELRQWTIRQLINKSPNKSSSIETTVTQRAKNGPIPIPLVKTPSNPTKKPENAEILTDNGLIGKKKSSEEPELEQELFFGANDITNILFPNDSNEFSLF